ncbi:WD domain, G-beta repeat protein (macronuclear) [Tetrahymena thermophila SB210]|uniref:WD domain, G-beta repeat protein n=1 Tax=Tetrahymena thermophila (strain SB210) TaxID=312017 RepID=I7M076_TETTS|nr:WD domain, G-beta repeat protein [Tetrahymena thermophila SB210]EAR85624.3 WD domain, G-beta repeat protein [Tetrahymena thermophila SB210]|eukprot:XP_001033287.3 WD domain, G-beta repeat protein [Tetrahymena thermophila SB210]
MEVLLQTQQKINQLHSIRKDNINNEQNLQTQNKLNSTNNKVQPKSNVCNKSDQALTKQAQENTQKCQIELSNLQNAIEKYNIFKCINSRSIKQSDIMVDESDEYLVSFLFSRFGEQNQKMQLNQNTKFDYSNQRHQDTIKKQKPSQAFNLSTFKEDLSINPLDINGQYNLVGLVEQKNIILYNINQKQKNEIKINYDSTKSTIFNTCIKFSEDQQNLFTVSDSEGAVVLLDLVNLQQIGLLQKQNKCVRVLDWQSPFVVTAAGKNNVIYNLDIRKKKYISQEFKLSQSNEVLSLRWNANKQDFVYSGSNKEISVWSSLQQNAPIFTQQSSHIFNVRALSWSNLKSNHFITGGGNEDGTLKLWDYHTQKNLYSVQAQNQITNILTPQNQFHGYFMTTYNTQSNAIEIWFEKNDSTLQKKVSLSTEQQKIVYGAISNFDDKVITSSSNGNFNLWESFN